MNELTKLIRMSNNGYTLIFNLQVLPLPIEILNHHHQNIDSSYNLIDFLKYLLEHIWSLLGRQRVYDFLCKGTVRVSFLDGRWLFIQHGVFKGLETGDHLKGFSIEL